MPGRDALSIAADMPEPQLKETPSGASPALAPFDHLELTIELGTTRLSLSEIEQLRPGAILALQEYLNDPVAIFAGTKLVGRGELLLIEGQMGVRMTELYRSQASV